MSTSTAVHSNAFNFLSFVKAGVDSRTGQYTVNLTLPETMCNDLGGPVLPISLSFNPLNTQNSGFGLGWELRLSQYNPGTQVLSLSTGETFKVTGMLGNEFQMQEQKIRSFRFYEEATNLYRVVHKSGMIEMLHSEGGLALPETIYSAEGHKVSLGYLPFGSGQRRLHTVTDGQGVVLLQVILPKPGENEIKILLRPDGSPDGALARLVLKLRNSGPGDEVYEVILPTEDHGSWRFNYKTVNDLHCITDIKSPFGGHETIEYAGNGHVFPGNARPPLPRVWKHISDPGFAQPVLEVRYSYNNSNLPNSSNNFLGNNSGITWTDDGQDNLYKVLDRYRYATTETHYVDDVAVRSIERTFNRFHLLTEEKTTQGSKVHQVFTTYYADDNLDLDFSSQSAQCQLPKIVETRWSEKGSSRSEKVLTTYDTHGNLTEQVQANMTRESYSYFPVTGIVGECPRDPTGFVRSLREKTVTPAPGHDAGAPVLRTRNRYALMPPVKGTAQDASSDWLVLTDETLYQVNGTQEHLLQHNTYTTLNDNTDALRHGRRTQQTITLTDSTTTPPTDYTATTGYAYEKLNSTFVGETVLQTTETFTGWDHGKNGKYTEKVVVLEHSLLHGEALLIRDENDVEVRRAYNALRQVILETVAPNTDYAASRTYRYYLAHSDRQQAYQEATDVNGLQTRTLFDGLNRPIEEQRQDKDNRSGARAEEFRCTYVARFNALGQIVEEVGRDWRSAEVTDDLVLTSRYTYNDWGEQSSMTRPDDVVEHRITDPITQTTSTWIEGMGKTVTRNNLFQKPDWVKRYALGDDPGEPGIEPLSEHHYRYDGLGRNTLETDALSRTTQYVYDAFDRMLKSILPDDTVVERRYAPHSSAELPITLQITPNDAGQDPILAGAQSFDGLERLTQLTVGPRVEKYEYLGSQLRVSKRTTPAGEEIQYFYSPGLTEHPTRIETPEDKLPEFGYDSRTTHLAFSQDSQGRHDYNYDGSGNLTRHSWKVDDNSWITAYKHSLNGRQLSRTDISNIDTHYTYGLNTGRLEAVRQGYLQVMLEYDTLGRLLRTTSEDTAARTVLKTELGYDDQGREIKRTLRFGDQVVRIISQTWQEDDRLLSRHLHREDGHSLLLEEFGYDSRGRLELYLCSGDELPEDRYGSKIEQQLFVFDALDNIILCRSKFSDGSVDQADFTYDSVDACQLIAISHTHPGYTPQHVEFKYDSNGNMLNDERGQCLRYDSQGRLLDVSNGRTQDSTTYRYDTHNHLFGVTEPGQPETLRFYQNNRLSNTVQDNSHTQFLHLQDQPLGQQSNDAGQTLLLMTDGKNSVIGECQQSDVRTATYNAYGERSSADTLESKLAFNGEMREDTDWYLLGRGYRAYNPNLMRFHSPDSQSPFGAGGVNPYMYCSGDPINFRDPTGHNILWDIMQIGTSVLSIMSGNPALIALGVTGVFAGQAALQSSMMGNEGMANKARTAGAIIGGLEISTALLRGAVKNVTNVAMDNVNVHKAPTYIDNNHYTDTTINNFFNGQRVDSFPRRASFTSISSSDSSGTKKPLKETRSEPTSWMDSADDYGLKRLFKSSRSLYKTQSSTNIANAGLNIETGTKTKAWIETTESFDLDYMFKDPTPPSPPPSPATPLVADSGAVERPPYVRGVRNLATPGHGVIWI